MHPHTDGGSTNSGALRPGTSVGQVFAFVAGFVALAAVGATLGWTLTKVPGPVTGAPATTPPVVSSSPPASPSPSLPSPSSPVASVTGFVIPDYAAQGVDFRAARSELIDQRMAVMLIFDAANTTAAAGSVERTQPAAGRPGRPGLTVKMFVAGPAPDLVVPAPQGIGITCETYAKQLVATGFLIGYQGNSAQAKKLLPADSIPQWTTTSTWNTRITLICTPDGMPPVTTSPSDTATPTPTDTQAPQ